MATCWFSRYIFARLLYGVTPAGGMFQQKIDEMFNGLLNVFSISDILIVGYDAVTRDNDKTLTEVMKICQQENLKLLKNKCNFRCTRIQFL